VIPEVLRGALRDRQCDRSPCGICSAEVVPIVRTVLAWFAPRLTRAGRRDAVQVDERPVQLMAKIAIARIDVSGNGVPDT